MGRVEGKVALVTGGAKGIGKAACLRLAEEGATVAVTDVEGEEGAAVVRQITEAGGAAAYWDLDVSDAAAVKTVFEQVHAQFGRLDVLVNNVGISGADKPTHEVTEAEGDQVMNVNVKGVFLCTKYAVPGVDFEIGSCRSGSATTSSRGCLIGALNMLDESTLLGQCAILLKKLDIEQQVAENASFFAWMDRA